MAGGGTNAGANVLTDDPKGNGFRGAAVTADPPNCDGTNGEAEVAAAAVDEAGNAPKPASLRGNAADVLKKDGKGEAPKPEKELAELPNNGEVDEAGDEVNELLLSLRATAVGKVGNKDAALVAADLSEPPNNDGIEAELILANAPMPLSLSENAAELPELTASMREKGEEVLGNKNEGDAALKFTAPPPSAADVDASANGLLGKK